MPLPTHVHIQNRREDGAFAITAAILEAAAARAGEPPGAQRFTVADDDRGFAEAMATAEILLTASRRWRRASASSGGKGCAAAPCPGARSSPSGAAISAEPPPTSARASA